MTPEEIAARSHSLEDAPKYPTLEETARTIEPALSPKDIGRLVKMGAKLNDLARANPDTPDGQRAGQMVAKIKGRLNEHFTNLDTAPQATAGPGTVALHNFADAATFGGSGKVADVLTKKVAPEADLDVLHDVEKQENRNNPGAATLGQIAGSVAPYGGPGLLFKAANTALGGLRAGAGASTAARLGVGFGRGAASTLLANPIQGGIRGAIEAKPGERSEGIRQGILKEVQNLPASMLLGGALGAAAEGARGIRYSHGQTGRDIRTVEDVGGGETSLLKGAKGGRYASPALKNLPGTAEDQVGEIARRAGDEVRGTLNKHFTNAGEEYAASTKDAADSGALAREVDVYGLYKQAMDLVKSQRTTQATKGLIENEVLKPLAAHLGTGMKLSDFNDFRGKLGDLAEAPVGGSTPETRQFGDLAESARGVVKDTAYGDINTKYAEAMDKLERAHQKLGFGTGTTHTDINNPTAAKKVANFVLREGQTTGTSGIQGPDARELLALYPELRSQLELPELLRAQQRLKPGLHAPGGGLHHLMLGTLRHNIEPLTALAYRAGGRAEAANPLFQAILRSMREQENQ